MLPYIHEFRSTYTLLAWLLHPDCWDQILEQQLQIQQRLQDGRLESIVLYASIRNCYLIDIITYNIKMRNLPKILSVTNRTS